MNSIQIRFLLFLFGCIGTRLFFTFFAKNAPINILRIMGYITILPAIGFFLIYTFGLRKTGGETLGKPIWWNNLRPIHGVLYGLFSYFAIQGNPNSWKILLGDTLFGLFSFLHFHYNQGNFKYLL